MKEKIKDNVLPLEFEGGWDQQDTLAISLYDVTFTEDFGKIKKGDSFASLFVDYERGQIEAFKAWEDEEPSIQMAFKISPNE